MANRMLRRSVWLGSLVAVSFAVGYLTLAERVGSAKRFTVRVSGAEGTPVSCAFEIDGMFHNSDGATLEDVRAAVQAHGFQFPIAVDRKTRTRRCWCGGRDDYGFTSVSFLLDRQGVIRYIHPGGQYVKGDAEYAGIESQIKKLLFLAMTQSAESSTEPHTRPTRQRASAFIEGGVP